MDKEVLWSLRLGFSARQSELIRILGLQKFLEASIEAPVDEALPAFLADEPLSIREYIDRKNKLRQMQPQGALKIPTKIPELRLWWLEKMDSSAYPLREKMCCFLHNHFVAASPKVKLSRWLYDHNMLLRREAFGNLKILTKKVLRSNALVHYLDGSDNKAGHINENLSRELLELFTLGIGNYSEEDVKNGARALAGLAPSAAGAAYRAKYEDNAVVKYFNKTGSFKSDEIVDIIFEQREIPYLFTRKILKWFLYDAPDEALLRQYGDFFRSCDFEIKPLLIKIFTDEYSRGTAGLKIKDPMVFAFQLFDELGIRPDLPQLNQFLKRQGMELFGQPNVKGWDGGTAWLTSQLLQQRNQAAGFLARGKDLQGKTRPTAGVQFWLAGGEQLNNKQLTELLSRRLLSEAGEELLRNLETILPHDFDAASPGAREALLRLFGEIAKTPEFQLI